MMSCLATFVLLALSIGASLENAITNSPHTAGDHTDTWQGIQFMRERQMPPEMRPETAHIAVVLTDGEPDALELCDFYGRSRGRVLSAKQAEGSVKTGVSLYGGALCMGLDYGLTSLYSNDPPRLTILPDITTLRSAPWCGGHKFKVADIICDTYWLKDMTPNPTCSRTIAKKQLKVLASENLSISSAFEMEFLLQTGGIHGVYSHRQFSKKSDFIFEIAQTLDTANIVVENMHTENEQDLFEFVLKPETGVISCDWAFVFSSAVYEMGDKGSNKVSLNSKTEDVGKHFNHSIWSGDTNMFGDERSSFLKHWLAGLMKHARAITPFMSPTVDCYNRLNKPRRPSAVFWDFDNSTACYRVKQGVPGSSGVYIENRMPSGMSNPYLVQAATVAAGLDGVRRKLECPPPGQSGQDEILPGSLEEAVDALFADSAIVESLGREFVEIYVFSINSDIRKTSSQQHFPL